MPTSTGVAVAASPFTAPASLNVRLAQGVTLDALHHIVDTIVKLHGCTTCGLAGVDLRLSGDPVEFQSVTKIQGVQSIAFGH